MDIERRAAQQTVLHVEAVTGATDHTRHHFRLAQIIPVRDTSAVLVGAAAEVPDPAAANRVGLHQDLLYRIRQLRFGRLRQSAAVSRHERLLLIPVMYFFVMRGTIEQAPQRSCTIC